MAEYLEKEILILGCGNILGSAVVQKLNEMKETYTELNSEKIGIIDAGTGASHFILSLIDDETPLKKIIIVDIIDYGLEPGELTKLYTKDLPRIPKYYIDAHDMPLAEMLTEIDEKYGVDITVIGCQYKYMSAPDVWFELSEEVEASVGKAAEMVIEELKLK
jgi:coenzyme F420-reducing hydrogenase delta subunit (putative coenzyme F420 hydrogenase processing subunit).